MYKNKYYCLLTVGLLLLFCACKTKKWVEKQTVIFDTGFSIKFRGYGYYYDQASANSYIYLTNTYNKIRFYDHEGNHQFTVPIKNTVSDIQMGVSINNLDTIICWARKWDNKLNKYHTHMSFINKEGSCYQSIHIDSLITPDHNDIYGFENFSNTIVMGDFVYYKVGWQGNKEFDIRQLDNESYLEALFKYQNKTPKLLKINMHTLESELHLPNLFRQYFVPDTTLYTMFIDIGYANEKVFVWGQLLNKVLVFDAKNLKLLHQLHVKSKYTNIGIPPFKMEEYKVLRHHTNDFNNLGRVSSKVLYDQKRDLYYFIVFHERSTDDFVFEEGNFSVITYNSKFRKLDEQVFEGTKLNGYHIIQTDKGLLIAANENTKDYDPRKCKFILYERKK
jgi:hypothetical protein